MSSHQVDKSSLAALLGTAISISKTFAGRNTENACCTCGGVFLSVACAPLLSVCMTVVTLSFEGV